MLIFAAKGEMNGAKVLAKLYDLKENFISGNDLAAASGINRMAVLLS